MKIIEITESLGPIAPKSSSGTFCPQSHFKPTGPPNGWQKIDLI